MNLTERKAQIIRKGVVIRRALGTEKVRLQGIIRVNKNDPRRVKELTEDIKILQDKSRKILKILKVMRGPEELTLDVVADLILS